MILMVVETTGAHLRPAVEASYREIDTYRVEGIITSPLLTNVFYDTGCSAQSTNNYDIYKNLINSDGTITATWLFTTPAIEPRVTLIRTFSATSKVTTVSVRPVIVP
jgi:hypothetical protein